MARLHRLGWTGTGKFGRAVTVLATGTIGGQALTVLAAPLLTRLYTPEEFGILAVYTALLSVLAVVANLRYQLAIPLPDSNREGAAIMTVALLVVAGMASLCALWVIPFRDAIASTLGTPDLSDFLWLLPVGLLLTGAFQALNYWAIRQQAYSTIARTKVVQSGTQVLVQLAGHTFGPLALVVGQVCGRAAGAILLGRYTLGHSADRPGGTTREEVVDAIRDYRRFPLHSTWSGLFNTAGRELPSVLLAALFSASAAGAYLLAYRILSLPLALLGKAIADVFYAQAASARRSGQIRSLVLDVYRRLTHFAMPLALILAFAGPELVTLLLGNAWRQAGEFAQWLAPMLYLSFVAAPLSNICSVFSKEGKGALFQLTLFVARVLALMVGAALNDVTTAIALFSVSSAGVYGLMLVWNVRLAGVGPEALVRPVIESAAWSLPLIAPVAAVQLVDLDSTSLALAFSLSALLVSVRYLSVLRGGG